MNKTAREIYDDYRYDLFKVGLELSELSRRADPDVAALNPLLVRFERLESLVDLYAYLLAQQSNGETPVG